MKTSRSHRGGELILLIFWASRPKIISSNYCPNQCAISKNGRPKVVVSHCNMCIKVFPNFELLRIALFCIVQSFHFLLREIKNITIAEKLKQSENNKCYNVKRDLEQRNTPWGAASGDSLIQLWRSPFTPFTRVNRINKLLTAQREACVLRCERRHAIIDLIVRITLWLLCIINIRV